MLGLPKSRVAAAAAFFCQGFVFASLLTQAPRLYDKVGLGTEDATFVILTVAIISGFGSVAAGMIAERRSSATALSAGLVGIALSATIIGLVPSIPWLFPAFAIYGLSLGAVDAAMNMQGVRVQAQHGRSLMNGFHGFWSIGALVGAGYAALVGWLEVPLSAALALVTAITLVVAWRARPHFLPTREVDPGLSAVGLPWRPVLVFGVVIVLFYAIDVGTQTWSPLYLDDVLDASAAVVPLGYALYQAGALLSRLLGDYVVEAVGAPKVLLGGVAVGVSGFLVVFASPMVIGACLGLFLAGLGLAVLAPLAFAGLGGAVPEHTLDVAIARMNLANYAGAILGGGAFGIVGGLLDLRWAWLVLVACAIPVVFTARTFRAVRDLDSVG